MSAAKPIGLAEILRGLSNVTSRLSMLADPRAIVMTTMDFAALNRSYALQLRP